MARLAIAALLLTLLAWEEMFVDPMATGFGDYQFFHHNWEFGRVAWSRFGEIPLYNPYYCGGIPDFGDPQSQVHHPLFFLSFVVGTTLGLKLFVFAHALAGLSGMYAYARRVMGLALPGAALAAAGWTFSGFFAWHAGTGHGGFVGFYLVPWLLLFWRRAETDLRFVSGVAAVLALAVLAGGAYVFPYMLLLLAFDALPRAIRRESRAGTLRSAVYAGVVALLLCAWRLIPLLEYLRYYPRSRPGKDWLTLPELLNMLTATERGADAIRGMAREHPYAWAEYGSFVGWGILLFGAAGFVIALRQKKPLAPVVGVLLFGSFAFGDVSPLSPWALLRRIPVYESLQVPSRFMFAALFFLLLLAGLALDGVVAFIRRQLPVRVERVAPALGALAAAALLVPVVDHHRDVLSGAWNEPPPLVGLSSPSFFLYHVPPRPRVRGLHPPEIDLPAADRGTGACYSGMDYFQALGLWAGASPQVQVPQNATLADWTVTPRTVRARVDLPEGGRVVFNRTWTPGFVASAGQLVSDHGRVAVDLGPGRHDVVVRYAPRSVTWGALASLLGLFVAMAVTVPRVARRLQRAPRVGATTAALCLGVAVLAYARGILTGQDQSSAVPSAVVGATASGYAERELSDAHAPARVLDSLVFTEWHAPSGESGWLDLTLSRPSPVATVALLNARNLPYEDRSTKAFRIEAFDGERLVASARGHFARKSAEPDWKFVPLGAPRADRVRIVVESWFGLGGGIAEARVY